jgi:AcrR family transcriptional regulator
VYVVQLVDAKCGSRIGMRDPEKAGLRKSPSGRRPGERAGLAVEAILAEARRVAEREGVEQLTMRRLAEGLGVAPNALYSHFADKSALLDALIDSLLADVEVPIPDEEEWQDSLLDLMRSTRRFLLAHADLLPHLLSRARRGPNAIRLGEETLKLLTRAGLEGEAAVDALRILLIYTFGFAAQEAPRRADPDRESRRRKSEEAFGMAHDEPLVRELAQPLSEHPSDDTFEKGLRWLLDGIRASVAGQITRPQPSP